MLELWTHDAITGDEITQVHPAESGAQWSMNLAGTGSCSFTFVVTDADTGMDHDEIDATFEDNSVFFALRWGTTVLGAWKLEDWEYDDDKGTVSVSGVELRNEAAWRMTYGVSVYESGTLAVTNRNRQGAVRAILQRFMQWSPDWAYPVDLPADGAGTFSATWEFWRKYTIADLLKQVEDDGVEIFFRPYLTPARQLRFETIVAVKVSVGTSYFHLQAEDSPLSGVKYKKSGAPRLTGLQGVGNGTGQDQAVAWAGNSGSSGIPIRDAKREFPDLTGARLQAATNAAFAAMKDPIVQWTVSKFTSSDEYPPSHAVVGRGWQLDSKRHRVFPDGPHSLRVISSSGSFSNVISTEVQSGI